MARTSKTTFIAVSKRNIEKYNSFANAIDKYIIPIVEEWNGKKMNKRFIDKVNEILKQNNLEFIRLGFDTNYRGERANRFRLIFDNRYVNEVNAYIDCNDTIVYSPDGAYIDEDFRLDAEKCVAALKRESETCVKNGQDLQDSIEQIDAVMSKYAELKAHVAKTLAEIPYPLRERIDVTCPIY